MKKYQTQVVQLGSASLPNQVGNGVSNWRRRGWTLLSAYVVDDTVFGIIETWNKV